MVTPSREGTQPIEVRLSYGTDCARIEPLIDLINEVAGELQVEIAIETLLVDSRERARALRSLGSPTMHVDGLDVEPAARWRKDYSHG